MREEKKAYNVVTTMEERASSLNVALGVRRREVQQSHR